MRWAPVVALLAGCYAPLAPEGAPCGDGLRPCPTGQMCNPADNRCYDDPQPGVDAPPRDSTSVDAPSSSACVPRRLLTGGTDVTAQGWTIERSGAGTITYSPGLTTLTTTANARQLIVLRGAFPPDRWALQITGELVATGGCTPNNAAAAFMASFHDPSGDATDYARMLCVAESNIAWGDGTSSLMVAFNSVGTIKLERTTTTIAGIKATVQATNGQASITAGPFTSNGAVAIGDQSTEPGLDSTMRIVSVDLMCP